MNKNELTEHLLGKEVSIRFLTAVEAVRLHDQSIEKVGGKPGTRDFMLLESALQRPMLKCLTDNDYDPVSLAACLADGISQNRPFLDGNKRTAFLACVTFLKKNGIVFEPDVAEATDTFRLLAAHEIDVEDLRKWIEATLDSQSEDTPPGG